MIHKGLELHRRNRAWAGYAVVMLAACLGAAKPATATEPEPKL
jgi:hypothetical protein